MQFIMLAGPSGCGKSTLAAEIEAKNTGLVVLSSDRIISDLCSENGLSYAEGFHQFIAPAKIQLRNLMNQALSEGCDILLDQTNLSRQGRMAILGSLPDDYMKIGVAFEADYPTLMERIHARRDKGGQEVPGYVLREQMATYKLPDYDEGFDRIMVQKVPSISPEVEKPEDAVSEFGV